MSIEYRVSYNSETIAYGRRAIEHILYKFERIGDERAVILCGSIIFSTDAVIDPIVDCAGNRVAVVFDKTIPDNKLTSIIVVPTTIMGSDSSTVSGIIARKGGLPPEVLIDD